MLTRGLRQAVEAFGALVEAIRDRIVLGRTLRAAHERAVDDGELDPRPLTHQTLPGPVFEWKVDPGSGRWGIGPYGDEDNPATSRPLAHFQVKEDGSVEQLVPDERLRRHQALRDYWTTGPGADQKAFRAMLEEQQGDMQEATSRCLALHRLPSWDVPCWDCVSKVRKARKDG